MIKRVALLALAAGLALVPQVRADDPRIDPVTGAERVNYPPDRHFDHIHMLLELDIPDMSKPFLTAVQTLTVAPIGRDRDRLVLDAGERMKIDSVTIGGKPQAFAHEKKKLAVMLDPPIRLGQQAQLRIAYSVEYPDADGTGLTWTPGSAREKSPTDKAPQIHSQGQPDYNHTWFPCQDFPNERLTTELILTVEDGYTVCSNGRLLRTSLAEGTGGKPRTRWHWLQDKPHCSYLVSLIVGKFSIVGLTDPDHSPRDAAGRPIPVYVYTPIGTERAAARGFAKTPAMIEHFSELFDEPYPWDKYSQAIVRNFRAGGMENTSATTLSEDALSPLGGFQTKLISHELAHQWFGDLITCKSWEHAWLNEGWASFAEALWEEADAKENKRQAYQGVIAGFLATQRAMNRTYAPNYPAMVSDRYDDPMQTFMKPNDIYAKGAIVLHMLREGLGDDVFFKGVRQYIDRHKFGSVETDDFRRALEEASGCSLERFFKQWCERPGMPRLSVKVDWEAGEGDGGQLKIAVDQTQRIDADNPAYYFNLPIWVKHESGPGEYVYINIDSRHHEASFPLRARPKDVVVDPGMTVAAPASVKKSLAMWLEQIGSDSVFARIQAAEHLKGFDSPEAAAALAGVVSDPGSPEPLVQAAAAALAELEGRAAAGEPVRGAAR